MMRKGKCLLLLVLCLCVLAWITTFSSNDVVKESPFKDLKIIEESPRRELESEMIPSVEEQTPKESCPEHSPLLRECTYFNISEFRAFIVMTIQPCYILKEVASVFLFREVFFDLENLYIFYLIYENEFTPNCYMVLQDLHKLNSVLFLEHRVSV